MNDFLDNAHLNSEELEGTFIIAFIMQSTQSVSDFIPNVRYI